MSKQRRATLIDQIRQAVLDSEMSRYEISLMTGVDQGALSRFVRGQRGLSEEALNKIGELLDLQIVARKRRKG